MAKKYIEAEKLKLKVNHEMDMQDTYLPAHFFDIVDDMPAADVQKVKHGRWERVGDVTYRCSVCGEISCCNSLFCGDCGAKMDEVEE